MLKLWRSYPVITKHVSDADISRDVIIPSARQGLTEAIAVLGLNRSDYVGIPDYIGHCVIDFIGRKATPVPVRFLPQKNTSAILIYDQWGWQKTSSARLELKRRYPNARVIWDRVDSLPLSFEDEAINGENDADIQLFSLSKTLGAGGGGLVWLSKKGWLQHAAYSDFSLVEKLKDILNDKNTNKQFNHKIDRFIRNECICDTPTLDEWLKNINVNAATEKENKLRRERINIFDREIVKQLPEWMQDQITDNTLPAPGIFPLIVNGDAERIATEISVKFSIEVLSLYHFNFNDSYLNPDWKEVVAIPLHSEITTALLASVVKYIKKL